MWVDLSINGSYWLAAARSRARCSAATRSARCSASPSRSPRPERLGRGGLGDLGRPTAEQVPDQPIHRLLEPAARSDERLGELADVAQRFTRLLRAGGEDEGVGGFADASLLAGQKLGGPQLVECLYDAPVGVSAIVGHDTRSPGRVVVTKTTF